MVRVLVYGLVAGLVGIVFGFTFFLFEGAIFGAVVGAMIGISIAAFVNHHGILDRPFFAQQDVDRIMYWESYRLSTLPEGMKRRFMSAIRSILEKFL
jgi:hypothetical protein